jgi:hypothetical protein
MTASITPAPLTIVSGNKTKSLGQDLPIFTATYRVLAGADTPASLGGFLLYDEREQFELAQR